MILEADQKGYIYSVIQIIMTIISTVLTIILIQCKANIHIIKLVTSLIYVIRPIILKYYVYKVYKINKNEKSDKELIAQRWNGIGHTIAYFVHNKTDVLVLTLMSTLNNVSIYSIYSLITNGLRTIISTITSPVQATFGNIIAKKEYDVMKQRFDLYEYLVNFITTILFSTGLLLIMPFMYLYTKNFDFNYARPVFAYILMAAEFIYCIRIPYHSIIIAAGHYKQTRRGAFIEAGINIIVSIILVVKFEIIGVAIGTLMAMLYRTIDYILYLKKNILCREYVQSIKRLLITLLILIINVIVFKGFSEIRLMSYVEFVSYGIITVVLTTIITSVINYIFYKKLSRDAIKLFTNIIKKNKKVN